DHGVHCDELLALEPVDQEVGRTCVIEFGKLVLDAVETLHRAAIVVLVVADDEPFRHSLDPRRIAAQRLYLIRHQRHSVGGRARISIWSNRVTLSSWAQSATRPSFMRARSKVVNSNFVSSDTAK